MSRGLHKAVNRFITTLKTSSAIDSSSDSGTFEVQDITVGGFSLPQGNCRMYATIDYAQTGKEEIFRIKNVNGSTLTYDLRISVGGYNKPTHVGGASFRINDVSELVNDIGLHVDTFGFTEIIAGTSTAFCSGGRFNNAGTTYSVPDITLTIGGNLVDNATNYVHFLLNTRVFSVTQSATQIGGITMASVVCSGGSITAITDLRPAFATTYGELDAVYSIPDKRNEAIANPGFYANQRINFAEFRPNRGTVGALNIAGASATWFTLVRYGNWVNGEGVYTVEIAYGCNGGNDVYIRSGDTNTAWGAWRKIYPTDISAIDIGGLSSASSVAATDVFLMKSGITQYKVPASVMKTFFVPPMSLTKTTNSWVATYVAFGSYTIGYSSVYTIQKGNISYTLSYSSAGDTYAYGAVKLQYRAVGSETWLDWTTTLYTGNGQGSHSVSETIGFIDTPFEFRFAGYNYNANMRGTITFLT